MTTIFKKVSSVIRSLAEYKNDHDIMQELRYEYKNISCSTFDVDIIRRMDKFITDTYKLKCLKFFIDRKITIFKPELFIAKFQNVESKIICIRHLRDQINNRMGFLKKFTSDYDDDIQKRVCYIFGVDSEEISYMRRDDKRREDREKLECKEREDNERRNREFEIHKRKVREENERLERNRIEYERKFEEEQKRKNHERRIIDEYERLEREKQYNNRDIIYMDSKDVNDSDMILVDNYVVNDRINDKVNDRIIDRVNDKIIDNNDKVDVDNIKKIVDDLDKKSKSEKKQLENLCSICFEAEKNIVMMPCKHLCACEECSKKVETCPICRGKINEMMRIFVV